jgi:hypothetical protein
MTVRYHQRRGHLSPDYICQRAGIEHAETICQTIHGQGLDQQIGELLLEMVAPVTLEVALAVQQQLQSRLDEVDRLRQQQVERARYEADLARRRYLQVDPGNRLVADALEADWNDKLRGLSEAQQCYDQQRQDDAALVNEQTRSEVLALATDFPRLWRDPKTSDRDRKRMVRLLIEDVTLTRAEAIAAQIRFKGGATRTLSLPLPVQVWQSWQTSPQIVAEIDRLLADFTDGQIAEQLNQRGLKSGKEHQFSGRLIARIRCTYRIVPRFERLRAKGLLTAAEVADELHVDRSTVHDWRRHGLLRGYAYNDKHQYLFEPVNADDRPSKKPGQKLVERRRFPEVPSQTTEEVHREA